MNLELGIKPNREAPGILSYLFRDPLELDNDIARVLMTDKQNQPLFPKNATGQIPHHNIFVEVEQPSKNTGGVGSISYSFLSPIDGADLDGADLIERETVGKTYLVVDEVTGQLTKQGQELRSQLRDLEKMTGHQVIGLECFSWKTNEGITTIEFYYQDGTVTDPNSIYTSLEYMYTPEGLVKINFSTNINPIFLEIKGENDLGHFKGHIPTEQFDQQISQLDIYQRINDLLRRASFSSPEEDFLKPDEIKIYRGPFQNEVTFSVPSITNMGIETRASQSWAVCQEELMNLTEEAFLSAFNSGWI
jgi:hypothetical protein